MKKLFVPILIVLLTPVFAFAQRGPVDSSKTRGYGLVIRGRVTGLEVERNNSSVIFWINLDVEFANAGVEPIILFAPDGSQDEGKSGYWLGGWAIYESELAARSPDARPIFSDGYWQSVSGSAEYSALAKKLDVASPPPGFTKVLRPGDSWQLVDRFRIYFEKEKHSRWPEKRTWKEMQDFPPQLWFTIAYELNPWNIEYGNKDLIRRLRTRWQRFGNVLVDEKKEGNFEHFIFDSEPIPIDLSQALVRKSEDEARALSEGKPKH